MEASSQNQAYVVEYAADTAAVAVRNYPEFYYTYLVPSMSHDGTRLGMLSLVPGDPTHTTQVWAARRNMNLPPAFSSAVSTVEGSRAFADTTVSLDCEFDIGVESAVSVSASDPEGDDLTYHASGMPEWMSWDPDTQTLSGEAPDEPGANYFIKVWVTTESGGTDSFIAVVTVANSSLARGGTSVSTIEGHFVEGPNPTTGRFALALPAKATGTIRFTVFDLSGREVARVQGSFKDTIVWDGRNRGGSMVRSGIYLWQLEAGGNRRIGKVVVMR